MDQQMYKLMFDQHPDAMVTFDVEGRLMAANPTFLLLAEEDFASLNGQFLSSFYLPADVDIVSSAMQKALAGELQRFEATLLTKKGNELRTQISIFPITAEGEIIGTCGTLRDVTTELIQKRMLLDSMRNYQRNQELLDAIVENAEVGIAVADLDGHFIIYNQAMVELIGVQQQDSRTYDWPNLYNIHDRNTRKIVQKSDLPMARAMQGESVKNEVYLIKNPVKGDVYLSVSSSAIRDQAGRIVAGMVIDRDVTQQTVYEQNLKTVIEELKQSNLRFKYATQAASDAIWDLNLVTKEVYWGEGFKSLFGQKAGDVFPNEDFWANYIAPEDKERVIKSIQEVINNPGQSLWEDEFRFKKGDNTFAMVTDKAIVIRDAQGKAVRMIGAMQDITRLKVEEQRLKLMESVVTNTLDAVMISDIEIRPNLGPKIVYVNAAFSTMTGYLAEDVITCGPRILYGKNTDEETLNRLWKAMATPHDVEVEMLCYTKTGEEFWIQMAVLPVQDSTGTYSHFVSILRNITDRKSHELEKEQLINRLTQNIKDLKQFTYITSHNLRSPLVNQMGLIGLIEDIDVENEDLKAIHEKFKISSESLIWIMYLSYLGSTLQR
jgi:PAS domain S-box-containing protein